MSLYKKYKQIGPQQNQRSISYPLRPGRVVTRGRDSRGVGRNRPSRYIAFGWRERLLPPALFFSRNSTSPLVGFSGRIVTSITSYKFSGEYFFANATAHFSHKTGRWGICCLAYHSHKRITRSQYLMYSLMPHP